MDMLKFIPLAGASLLMIGTASANNSDQMIGYSGLPNAMGGAVVATSQDVITALSNPAGLSFLDMGLSKTRFDINVGLLPTGRCAAIERKAKLAVEQTGCKCLCRPNSIIDNNSH